MRLFRCFRRLAVLWKLGWKFAPGGGLTIGVTSVTLMELYKMGEEEFNLLTWL